MEYWKAITLAIAAFELGLVLGAAWAYHEPYIIVPEKPEPLTERDIAKYLLGEK